MIKKLIKNCKLKIVNWRRGFTLIELLIVIAIIGVLATLLMVNFVGVRQRARDAQRKSDLRQIQSALEIYRADSSSYPLSLAGCGLPFSANGTTYMQKVPCDPLSSGNYVYTYVPGSGNMTYSIYACLENVNDSQKDTANSSYCTGGSTNWSYTVNSP